MARMTQRQLVVSYALWAVGSALFTLAAIRSGDWLSFVGSVMYFIGSITFLATVTGD